MTILSSETFINLMCNSGYCVLKEERHKPLNLNIVGMRNRFARTNYFDDTINIYYQECENWIHKCYPATTLPGTPHLLKPLNTKGAAILKPGQYRYKKGKHKGREALVQADYVKVYRDNNKDLVYNFNNEEEGFFGINIHEASWGSKLVGVNSAGCQVIKEGFEEFMNLINRSLNFRENSFMYTLLEI